MSKTRLKIKQNPVGQFKTDHCKSMFIDANQNKIV